MKMWKSTGNVLSWLYKQSLSGVPFVMGSLSQLPIVRANQMCASMVKNDIAHLVLEIASPKVLEVERDVKVTFSDKLGTVGKPSVNFYIRLYKVSIMLPIISRENMRL
jgi:hypothetical protein